MKTLPFVAIASPNAAPAAANQRREPVSPARVAQSRQRATKKVSQLSVVKKCASWMVIGANAATAAAARAARRLKARAARR